MCERAYRTGYISAQIITVLQCRNSSSCRGELTLCADNRKLDYLHPQVDKGCAAVHPRYLETIPPHFTYQGTSRLLSVRTLPT
ncbi:hypothetical protein J6590_085940 [Homalodisca vitripennis]|nr:hypothetical protein J6590_085940 [Homalodisca vitripennis]